MTGRRRSHSSGRKADRPKPKRLLPPEVLTDAEVRALIDACPSTSATGLRNRALLAILYRTGLRIAEALDLYPKDVDLERGAIRVLHGKGDKMRVVGVDHGALVFLERWLDVRACCGHASHATIFCTASGGRLTSGYSEAGSSAKRGQPAANVSASTPTACGTRSPLNSAKKAWTLA